MFISFSRCIVLPILILGFTLASTGCNSKSDQQKNNGPSNVADKGADKEPADSGNIRARQASATPGNSKPHPYVTKNCQAAIIVHPQKIYQSELLTELLKSETIRAFIDDNFVGQFINNVGVDIREITRFSLLLQSLPGSPQEALSLAMIFEFSNVADRTTIIEKHSDPLTPEEQDGRQWYHARNASPISFVCIPDTKTLVFGTDLALTRQIVSKPAAKNPLNRQLIELDYQNQAGLIVGKRDLFPPGLMAAMQEEVRTNNLPPAFAEVTTIMAELRKASIILGLSPDFYLELDVTTSNADNTAKLQTMINDSLTLMKSSLSVLVLAPPKEMPASMRPVLQGILKLLAQIKLQQSQSRLLVTMKVPSEQLVALKGPLDQLLAASIPKSPKIPELHVVQGKVTIDGKPLADARVALHRSEPGASRVFAANTNAEGIYNIKALYTGGEFTGAPAGRYKVTVIKVSPSELSDEEFARQYQQKIESGTVEGNSPPERSNPPYLVNPQYVSVMTTPFEIVVQAGNNKHDFSLTNEPPLKK